jgi:hypothetical protein
MFKIFKRLKKIENQFSRLDQETSDMMIIMHNLIEDLRNSGESRVNEISFSNCLYKALEGHYQAIRKLINIDELKSQPITLRTSEVSKVYSTRFSIKPRSRRRKS